MWPSEAKLNLLKYRSEDQTTPFVGNALANAAEFCLRKYGLKWRRITDPGNNRTEFPSIRVRTMISDKLRNGVRSATRNAIMKMHLPAEDTVINNAEIDYSEDTKKVRISLTVSNKFHASVLSNAF